MICLANRENGRNSDIPVSKKKQQSQNSRRDNPYSYEELIRRENGQAPKRRGDDVYVDRNRAAERRSSGVVGSTGRKAPRIPNPREIRPNNVRIYLIIPE